MGDYIDTPGRKDRVKVYLMSVCYIHCAGCDMVFVGPETLAKCIHFCVARKPDLRIVSEERATEIANEQIEREYNQNR